MGSFRNRRRIGLGTAAVTATFLVGITANPAIADAAISINNFAFIPQNITITAGETVTWTQNQRGQLHTTTSDAGAWNSGNLRLGQSFSRAFTTPGTFPYHCNIHPRTMRGTITVT